MAPVTINPDVLTLINVFTVEPSKQSQLADLLIEATESVMKHQEGFVSANIHKSLDGKFVVNYAQWRDQAAFDAMLQNPQAREHMKKAGDMAQFNPILCKLADSVGA